MRRIVAGVIGLIGLITLVGGTADAGSGPVLCVVNHLTQRYTCVNYPQLPDPTVTP